MIAAIFVIPILAGLVAMLVSHRRYLFLLLVGGAVAHSILTGLLWVSPPAYSESDWLGLDWLGLLFLAITSVLFLSVAIYLVVYLKAGDPPTEAAESIGGLRRDSVFVGGTLLFLGTMTLVTVSQNFGVLWVAVEATTLSSASLIYFHRNQRSLEATWKYLLIGSVGIALALAGNFFLAMAGADGETGITVTSLVHNHALLDPTLIKIAFVLFLVGYGTKMGLAPMHNWLPDAHSEAPSAVSALLSGALLNCALLAILRARQVLLAVGGEAFGSRLMVAFGIASLLIAAIFIVGQRDYKRLLAYSSVEHMGIIALGIGLGGWGIVGALLHSVNHSLAKAGLFLTSGNILTIFRTKEIHRVRGLLRVSPGTGILWIVGLLAITGTPPFGTFPTEFAVLRAAIEGGRGLIAATYLAALAVIFIGMASVMVNMGQGEPSHEGHRVHPVTIIIPGLLLAGVLLLGFHVPAPLLEVVQLAATTLGAN